MPDGGYTLAVTGTWPVYQADDAGRLRRVSASGFDLTRPFFSAPGFDDADHDQGDEHCPNCGAELTLDGCGCLSVCVCGETKGAHYEDCPAGASWRKVCATR